MKKQLVLLAAGALALVSRQGLSQNVTYVSYKAPVYRHATDQRFSNHRQVFFMADISPALCNQIVSSAYKKDSMQAIFQRSAAEELEKLKYNTVKDSLDMSVGIVVKDLEITPYQGAGGMGRL